MCVQLIPKDKSLEAESWVRGYTVCQCFWFPVPNCPVEMLVLFTHTLSSVSLIICMFQNEFLLFLRSYFMALENLSIGSWMKALANVFEVLLVNVIWSFIFTQPFCSILHCLDEPVLLLVEDSGRDSNVYHRASSVFRSCMYENIFPQILFRIYLCSWKAGAAQYLFTHTFQDCIQS